MGTGRFWKLRQRFGIAAPRVAIHSQIPWYWRWIGIAVLLGVAAASAAWIYDAGRRFAGFDRSEVTDELSVVRRSLDETREELERLRAVANAADSRVSIERTAQQNLAQQIRALEQENARLKEELATFESMLSSEARNAQALTVHRFKVEPDLLPGEYRYRLLLLTPSTRRERDFHGRTFHQLLQASFQIRSQYDPDLRQQQFHRGRQCGNGVRQILPKVFIRHRQHRVPGKSRIDGRQTRTQPAGEFLHRGGFGCGSVFGGRPAAAIH